MYRANSGIIGNIPGALAKVFGGKSTCTLCDITHGPVREKPEWERFITSLREMPETYHADDMPVDVAAYLQRNGLRLPVVLERNGDRLRLAASSADIASCRADAGCLIARLRSYGERPSCAGGACATKKPER